MKVGAIIISHNHRAYLHERIRSVFTQRFKDVAIYGYDDHSTDGSGEILRSSSVKPLHFGPKIGRPIQVWQRILEKVDHEYLWFAEGDDTCKPNFLERCVELLESDVSVGMAYCHSSIISADGEVLEETPLYLQALHPSRWNQQFVLGGEAAVRLLLSARNSIPNASACVFRRSALLQAGLDQIPFHLCGDWMAYARLALKTKIAFTPEKLNLFRVHANTVRAASDKDGSRLRETYEVQAAIARICALGPEEKERAALASFAEWRFTREGANSTLRTFLDSAEFATTALAFDERFHERKEHPGAFRLPFLEVAHGPVWWLASQRRIYSLAPGIETEIAVSIEGRGFWWRVVAPEGSIVTLALRSGRAARDSLMYESQSSKGSWRGWARISASRANEAVFRICSRLS